LQDFWAAYKQQTIDGQAAIDAANADWMNGVTSAWKDFNAQQNDNAKIANQLTTDFLNGSSDALSDFLSGNKTATQSLKDFFTSFEAEVTKAVSKKLMQSFFDSLLGTDKTGASGSGAGGSSYIDFISSLFSSSGDSSFFPSFAVGGNIGANTFARVNENGPEMLSIGGQDYLMTGSQGGKITPHDQLGGGRGVNQYNSFYIAPQSSLKTQTQIANQASAAQRRASRLS
jgi:lambda family phage tail tape measure protein